jgi:predicted NBD/HSP70 family sugar kinase
MHGHTTRIGELVDHDLNRIDAETMVQAAREGDPIAVAILERAGKYLGIAVGNILGVISPQRVIFSGGVSRAGDLLLKPILETVNERKTVLPSEKVEFVLAELGINGGLIGAALWAKRRCEEIGDQVL